MIYPAYINTNREGIPALRSIGVTVTATEVQIAFRNHRNVGRPFFGGIWLNIAQAIPAGTTTTLPVVVTSEGNNAQPLTAYDGAAVTVADLPGTGVYLAFYDQSENRLQLVGTYA
ncbi:MAG: hypothetical protein IJZ45_03865 [Bacteroidaceae bacterium]|nr:hypothetical protein [Bacteroidaceae bacterium]